MAQMYIFAGSTKYCLLNIFLHLCQNLIINDDEIQLLN